MYQGDPPSCRRFGICYRRLPWLQTQPRCPALLRSDQARNLEARCGRACLSARSRSPSSRQPGLPARPARPGLPRRSRASGPAHLLFLSSTRAPTGCGTGSAAGTGPRRADGDAMTLDLSAVTDSLIGLVKSQWTTAPIWTEIGGSPPGPTFTPNFTGLAPDAVRQQPGPQLSMYLYHVESDTAQEALFWQAQMLDSRAGQPTRFLPLALNLFYLLFAYSESSYTQEQEAMSIALRICHANPIVRSDPGTRAPWELTLTMEHRSYDEMSRLWQATTAPMRMSVVYRAAVVFIDPDPMPAPAPEASSFSVTASPVPLPSPGTGGHPVLFGTFRAGSYTGPAGKVPYSRSPATVAAGQTAWLLGSDLGASGISDTVYLMPPGADAEVDVTAWAVAGSSAAKFVLALPADAPDPGVYQLRVGSGTLGEPGAIRSGSVPLSIAASVEQPPEGPVLDGRPPFTVRGGGFTSGRTEVLVGTVALTEAAAPPGAGQVSGGASGTSFSFSPPAGPTGSIAPVRVLVNGIESDPALWVTL
jgi:Pvc16 N-terminal domain